MLKKTYLTISSSSTKEALQQAVCILDAMKAIHLTPETPPTVLEGHNILTALVSNAVQEAVQDFPSVEAINSPWVKIAPETLSDEERKVRNKELLKAFNRGDTISQLCAYFNISSPAIYKILRKLEGKGHEVRNLEPKRGQTRSRETKERNDEIKKDYLNGMTYYEIAIKHKIAQSSITGILDTLRREGEDIPFRMPSKTKTDPSKSSGKE